MKKILMTTAVCALLSVVASAQLSFGVRASYSPTVNPRTDALLINPGIPETEALFNADKVKYPGQIGVTARYDMDHFWFMSELMYGYNKTTYSKRNTYNYTEFPTTTEYFTVSSGYLELPVTAGVKLGIVEIFSGLYLDGRIHGQNDLTQIDGYRDDSAWLKGGWLSGIGVNLDPVLVDIRYQQLFTNYGKDQYLNGQELLLKNAPARMTVSAAFMF